MSDPASILLPLAGGVLATVCLLAAYRYLRRCRLLEDLPTSKTTGVFIGLVELKGRAEAERPLLSYLAEMRCVYYQWSIAESWSRTVTETYTDSNGKTQTRTRTESGWTTLAEATRSVPFYLRDDYGTLLVEPQHATIEAASVFDQYSYPSDALYYGKGPRRAVSNSDHVRRFSETAIPLHARLYVVGQARERDDVVAPKIAYDDQAPMFLISTRNEEQVTSGYRWGYAGLVLLGLVLCAGGFALHDQFARSPRFDGPATPMNWIWATAAYLALASLGWIWTAYNSLVSLRQRVRQGWSSVEVQLKRRNDLIPNLVSLVTALRDHERVVQTELVHLRSQLQATPPGHDGPDYHAVSARLVAIAEAYPQLKSQPSFLRLQQELIDTEHRIALARSYYNEIVSYWNTRLEQVPDRFVAALAGMRPQLLLLADGFERQPVRVALVE
jgi:hypothetical protein